MVDLSAATVLILVVLQIFAILATVVTFCNIKFNDLKHLGKTVEEVKSSQKDAETKREQLWKQIDLNGRTIAAIDARCQERIRK